LPEVTTRILAKVIHPKDMEIGTFSRTGVQCPWVVKIRGSIR